MNRFLFLVNWVCLMLYAAGLSAQAPEVFQNPVIQTISFPVTEGQVKIWLPDDLMPGDQVSGTVQLLPGGTNKRQLLRNMEKLQTRYLQLGHTKVLLKTEVQTFTLNLPAGTGNCPVNLFNSRQEPEGQYPVSLNSRAEPVSGCYIPYMALAGSPVKIHGQFDGDLANTRCSIGRQPVTLLAESPRGTIFQLPATATGMQTMEVHETNGASCKRNVNTVQLAVQAGKTNLHRGEKTFLDVKITGLERLNGTATLSLRNTTPFIIQLQPANEMRIAVNGGNIQLGEYNRRFEVESVATGSFIVKVDLDLPGFQYNEKLPEPRPLEDMALHTGFDKAVDKIVGDAGGARGKEYDKLCDNCKKCISAMAGSWAEALVKDLGEGILKEFAGKAVDMFMGSKEWLERLKKLIDKAEKIEEKAEKLTEEVMKKIQAGELKLMVFKDQLCASNKNCLVSALLFYEPATGCVTAFVECKGRVPDCCPQAFNTIQITYCTDERGMPVGNPNVEVVQR